MRKSRKRSRLPIFPFSFAPLFGALLLGLLAFRLFFGLAGGLGASDELQVYLAGLKSYATGQWLFIGSQGQDALLVPGALPGLLVALPFHVLRIPEAPYLLLNLLSFLALSLFAWYVSWKLPSLPPWFTWTWTLTAPWVLQVSTRVGPVSYVLFGSVVFFIGFLETLPFLRTKRLPPWAPNAMMGFALFWTMQWHPSWVLLLPYLGLSFYLQGRSREGIPASSWLSFFGGALVTGSLLIPGLVKTGPLQALGGVGKVLHFNPGNLGAPFVILGHYFSFASFEIIPFAGADWVGRLDFFRDALWLLPVALLPGLVGLLQPGFLLVQPLILFFVRAYRKALKDDWKAVHLLSLGTFLLLWVPFFAVRTPAARSYCLVLPVVLLQSFYVWEPHLRRRRVRKFAAAFLACGILYHLGFTLAKGPERSLSMGRPTVVKVLKTRDAGLLGDPGSGPSGR